MTTGGVEVVFVTVTVPFALVMTRIGATTRAVAGGTSWSMSLQIGC